MNVWDVPGQEHAVEVLRQAVERDEVSHAWAFIGPAGVGQEAATRWLAAALNCGSFSPPCGACDVCRRCLSGAYPALSEYVPIGVAYRKEEVLEQWLRTASRSLSEGRTKVLRITRADRMYEAAANTFLKGLEEPPPNTVWILEITDPEELPETILSRCRVVRFSAWADALLDRRALECLPDEQERTLAVRAAMGSPLDLDRFTDAEGLDDLRAHRSWPALLREGGPGMALIASRRMDDEVKRRTAEVKAAGKQELESLTASYSGEPPPAVVRQFNERQARREREARLATTQAALDDLGGWLRDCVVVATGGEPLIHIDAADAVGGDAMALGPRRLLDALDLVLETRESLEMNVQQGLTLEAMFLRLSALTYG